MRPLGCSSRIARVYSFTLCGELNLDNKLIGCWLVTVMHTWIEPNHRWALPIEFLLIIYIALIIRETTIISKSIWFPA
jgi:hypothetical protein